MREDENYDDRLAYLEYMIEKLSFALDETNKIITDLNMKIDKLESIYCGVWQVERFVLQYGQFGNSPINTFFFYFLED